MRDAAIGRTGARHPPSGPCASAGYLRLASCLADGRCPVSLRCVACVCVCACVCACVCVVPPGYCFASWCGYWLGWACLKPSVRLAQTLSCRPDWSQVAIAGWAGPKNLLLLPRLRFTLLLAPIQSYSTRQVIDFLCAAATRSYQDEPRDQMAKPTSLTHPHVHTQPCLAER